MNMAETQYMYIKKSLNLVISNTTTYVYSKFVDIINSE